MNLKAGLKNNQSESYGNKDGGFAPTCFKIPDGMELYKPKAGTNKIDILPFIKKDGTPAYVQEYYQHISVGVKQTREVCLAKTFGRPCPICEERQQLLNDGKDWKDASVSALTAKRRVLYNVIDLQEPDKGVQLFEVSHFLFEKNLVADAYDEDPEMVFADLQDGRTVSFKGREKTFNGKASVSEFDSFRFEQRAKPYGDDILQRVVKLDTILTPKPYDVLKGLFYGSPDADEEEEPEFLPEYVETAAALESEPEPPRRKKKASIQECPIGQKFGTDFDLYEDCDTCPIRKDCEAAS